MMPRLGWLLCGCFLATGSLLIAQDVAVSPPQKVNSGAAQFTVLGNTREGLLVHYHLRGQHVLYAFYPSMQLRWKKNLSLRERQADIRKVLLSDDSLTVLYSLSSRGQVLLYGARFALKPEQPVRTVLLDTLASNVLVTSPALEVRQPPDEQHVVIWFEDVAFSLNKRIYLSCYDQHLRRIWKQSLVLELLSDPEVIEASADSSGHVLLTAGDRRNRMSQQAFPYRRLLLLHVRGRDPVHSLTIDADHLMLSPCLMKRVHDGRRVLLSGLYLQSGAREAGGYYFLVYDTSTDSLVVRSYVGHTAEGSTEGGRTSRPSAFSAYRPVELVPTRSGGALLICEAQDVSTEMYPNPAFGTFGMTTGFAVSYFHFDDVSVVAFRPDGQPEWRKVLRKRQSTEGDGGYYSSIAVMIAPEKLYFLFNDFTPGTTVTTAYSLDAAGNVERNQLFNAERMGLWPVMRQGRQVSQNEMMVPSLKKNYLQFVRIRF
ncbi:MAG: hypothetical protein RMK52_07015 [Chitinophagales bacterium]|nr:hypothetical protein [Chitinophagales bacterium]